MANDSITDLKNNINAGRGLAVQNRFRITIDGEDRSLDCESASMPGRQVMSLDYQANRQSIKVPTTYLNEDVTLTFLVKNDFEIVDYFRQWVDSVINRPSYRLNFVESYRKEIQIEQLDKSGNRVDLVKLINAWPVTVNALNLDNTAEHSPQKLVVTLTYDEWTYTKGSSLIKKSVLFGSL